MGDLWIHPVLVVQVDVFHAKALQAHLARRLHVLGPAVHPEITAVDAPHIRELGRDDHHFPEPAAEGLRQEHLVVADPVHVCRVEEIDPKLHRPAEE